MALIAVVLPLAIIFAYRLAVEVGHPALHRWFDIREKEGRKPPRLRGAAEIGRFVEEHPRLSALKIEQARIVAAVLLEELDHRNRSERRFQLMIAVASLLGGYFLARV
jgi:hypothetical protein